MTIPFFKLFLSILPFVSIFIIGYYYPPSNQILLQKPIFQPPSWVFSIIWTYITISFGYISVDALYTLPNKKIIFLFYSIIFILLNLWLIVNSNKRVKEGFYILLATSYISILYLMYLSSKLYKNTIYLIILPFWLIVATCLNGVIYNNISQKYAVKV
jgi:tryptophan-rich sensory protein